MTTITMKEVAAFLLGEASLDGYWFGERHPISPFWWREHLRASQPATAPEQMPLERDCICHQDLHIDGYSGGAAPEGLYGALWVVVEGVGKKYVLADQSSEPKDMPAPATAPAQPAWHDAPTVPGIWLCDEGDICYTWTAHNIEILDQFDPGDGLRWYGPIQEDKP